MKRLEFSKKTRVARYDIAGGKCEAVWSEKRCNAPLPPVEYHHEKEAEAGGDNSLSNCRCVCVPCHKVLTAIFVRSIRKADRQRAEHLNAKPAPSKKIESAGFKKSAKALAREARGPRQSLPPRRLYQ